MKTLAVAIALCAIVELVGCGGGGSGSPLAGPEPTPRPTPPPPPPPACIRTADLGCIEVREYEDERRRIEDAHNSEDSFRNHWGLGAVGADRAWAQIELEHGAGTEPGSGSTVGAIDTGIDTGHPVFAGKTVTEHFFSGAEDEDGSESSHGTAVASVMVARPDDAFTASVDGARGVAWGADIAMFALRTSSPGPLYNPISPAGLGSADARWKERFDTVINWSNAGRTLDFVNVSVGFQGIIEQFSEQQLRNGLPETIVALAQLGASDKTVFVSAAGNAEGRDCDVNDFASNPDLCADGTVNARSPEVLAGLPARIAELRGHFVSVAATAEDGTIAPFSNRCGIAADWCLGAPGADIRTAYFGPHPDDDTPEARGAYNASGTSFAAPMVTGGLAVMKHRFRDQLSNTDLVSRLLATADKEGIYADRSVYGQGLMDLGAGTAPVGATSLAYGDRVDGPGVHLAGTRLALGGALGDGLARAFAGHEIAAFDELGAPFWYPLGDLAGAAPGPPPAARLRAFMAPAAEDLEAGVLRPGFASLSAGGPDRLRLGLMEAPPPGTGGGHLSLAGNALTLRAATERGGLEVAAFAAEGWGGPAAASGATLSWRPPGAPVGLRSGLVAERETLLGSRPAGAFGRVSGRAAFAGIEGTLRFGAWRLDAGAELGTVEADARGGILTGVTPLTTSAFALRAERPLAEGTALSFSLSQPLRVEAGRATVSVPVGRTPDGRVLRHSFTARLEPTGRQLDLAAKWRRPLAAGGELRLGAGWALHPGHDAATDPEVSFIAGWRRSL